MINICTTTPTARKKHICDGDTQIREYDPDNTAKHKCKGINKGTKYIRQVNKMDDVYTWKSCVKCSQIIHDNSFFTDDW